MKLYRFEDAVWQDFWGKDTQVKQWADVVDVEITGTRPYDNGYEIPNISVAKSIYGIFQRVFDRPIEIDYFSGSNWYERDENWKFISGPWKTESNKYDRYIDFSGNPIKWEDIK